MVAVSQETGRFLMGIDVGGTHTDLALSHPGGIARSKALTTHDDYSIGVLDAIKIVASDLDMTTDDVLGRCQALVNGTTIVTNAITEVRGARVGVLVTTGFRDTFRLIGGARRTVYDDHLQVNPPDVARREDIIEIDERIDVLGTELVPLDEEAVRHAARRLRDAGVAGIAICFLWSFKQGAHEQRARELIREEWPQAFVTLSSEIHPVIREYERFLTSVFNCFCQPAAAALLDTLGQRLADNGFRGTLSFFSGAGGVISRSTADRFPVLLLGSGPAGGVIGATRIAEQLGVTRIMTGDMGGTSFDAALIQDGTPSVTPRVAIDEFDTGISVVDVVSVGAGGGSVSWIDQRGVPQVGPHSAGSMPGPASYGRGGTEPTVTDAAVVLGLIDPTRYLGGRMQLDVDAARTALDKVFPHSDGWTPEVAAEGIVELTCTNMAHALRGISIERGHDPRDFLLLAYGGTLPFFVTRICDKLGMTRAVVPPNSSVFSAFGLLTADYVRRHSRSVEWMLSEIDDLDRVNRVRATLLDAAAREAANDGLDIADCELEWSGELRFQGQVFEVSIPLPDRPFTARDAATMERTFPEAYERTYGAGTAWQGSPVVLLTLNLTVSAARPRPVLPRQAEGLPDPTAARRGFRQTYDIGRRQYVATDVYADELMVAGMVVCGPAIIEAIDTTLVITDAWECRRDGLGCLQLSRANRGD